MGNDLPGIDCGGPQLQKAENKESAIHLLRVEKLGGVLAVDLAGDEHVVQVRIDVAVEAEFVQHVECLRERHGVLVGPVAVNTRNMSKTGAVPPLSRRAIDNLRSVRRSIDCRSETATLAPCLPRGLRHAPLACRKHFRFCR